MEKSQVKKRIFLKKARNGKNEKTEKNKRNNDTNFIFFGTNFPCEYGIFCYNL